ncbi:MAG: hypothetical protein LBU62_11755 [Bacteroidales bacterium]|jgi:hypothetical protein|nr:hypothetical protein [Bacteroidales bacterium]
MKIPDNMAEKEEGRSIQIARSFLLTGEPEKVWSWLSENLSEAIQTT